MMRILRRRGLRMPPGELPEQDDSPGAPVDDCSIGDKVMTSSEPDSLDDESCGAP